MSDFAAYHAMGHGAGTPGPGQHQPDAQNQANPPQFRPPVAATPIGYQQTSSPYGYAQPGAQQQQYGASRTGAQGFQDPGYFPVQGGSELDHMTGQMGGLGLHGDGAARGHKKKHRHAHHDLQQPTGSSQAFNGCRKVVCPTRASTLMQDRLNSLAKAQDLWISKDHQRALLLKASASRACNSRLRWASL